MYIDIQPYLDKLDLLKEYMCLKIDGKGKVFMVNTDAIPYRMPTKELLRIWDETGLLFCTSIDNDNYEPPKEITFEEFYQQRQKQLANAHQ